MKLIYRTENTTHTDEGVTSVVGSGNDVLVFTSDYGQTHHKYLITENNIMKRYELTSSLYRTIRITSWRITA